MPCTSNTDGDQRRSASSDRSGSSSAAHHSVAPSGSVTRSRSTGWSCSVHRATWQPIAATADKRKSTYVSTPSGLASGPIDKRHSARSRAATHVTPPSSVVEGALDVKALEIQAAGGARQPCSIVGRVEQLDGRIGHRATIPIRRQAQRIAPAIVGPHAARCDDRAAVLEQGHQRRPPRADAVGVWLHEDIATLNQGGDLLADRSPRATIA